jgi:uncharacterized protein (UPF0335 family)
MRGAVLTERSQFIACRQLAQHLQIRIRRVLAERSHFQQSGAGLLTERSQSGFDRGIVTMNSFLNRTVLATLAMLHNDSVAVPPENEDPRIRSG